MTLEQPAIHKKWIKEGKMTEEESQRIMEEAEKSEAGQDKADELRED